VLHRYFREVLYALSTSPGFYSEYVRLPEADEDTPSFIHDNPKFSPFFDGAVGAIDGTHINCCPSSEDRHAARDRKGGVTQNCLAACSWDMQFQYIVSGWDGSCGDAEMYEDARLKDFKVPRGKYYLADAGFGTCETLLVPYRGVRYHLAEWGRAEARYVLLLVAFE
jgi:hypothetical protein